MPSNKEEILRRINFLEFFRRYITIPTTEEGKNEIKVKCPFHEDDNPSMSINMSSGLWKCFGCQAGGDVFTFVQMKEGKSFPAAVEILERIVGIVRKTIQPERIEEWHRALLADGKRMRFWMSERKVTVETLKKYKIGFDGQRYTIPVMNFSGEYVNIRRYKPKDRNKMMSYQSGMGESFLFPISSLDGDSILITEGEPDVLCALSQGFNAITGTTGAMGFPEGCASLFAGKSVDICYDNDKAGKDGEKRTANILAPYAKQIRIVHIPFEIPKGCDITDFFVNHSRTVEDFHNLISEAEIFEQREEEKYVKPDLVTEYLEVPLKDTTVADLSFRRIKTRAIVAGKTIAPYIIPSKIMITCKDMCEGHCLLKETDGKKIYNLEIDKDDALRMVNKTKAELFQFIKTKNGISSDCYKCEIDIVENKNIEVVRLIPDFEYSENKDKEEYVITTSYVFGHGIHYNQPYEFEGIALPNPKTQEATHLFCNYKEIRDGLAGFTLSAEKIEELKIFQPVDGDIQAKLDSIYDDLSHNVTRIFFRNDIHLVLDLIYHSVLSFDLMGQRIDRGWAECIIVGDTQTGKSETANRILKHYKCGEFISGENCSYAGLVGGLANVGNTWSVFWGKLPLNNRRLVILDETSGMSYEDIQNLTGIRSSGIAEVVKVQIQQKAPAKTRGIYLGNPRSNQTIDTYNYGCLAIRELIGRPEDISRFDLGMTVTRAEVDMSDVFKETRREVPKTFTSDLCHSLILWAWSRKPEDVVFEEGAIDRILYHHLKLTELYEASDVPLVTRATQKIKLARLSVALAVRLFSTSNGEDVIVKREHVDTVAKFMNKIYSKQAMDLFGYSTRLKNILTIDNEEEVKNVINAIIVRTGHEFINYLLNAGQLRLSDIQESVGDREIAKGFMKNMIDHRCFEKKHTFYVKTPGFILFLKRMIGAKETRYEEETPDF